MAVTLRRGSARPSRQTEYPTSDGKRAERLPTPVELARRADEEAAARAAAEAESARLRAEVEALRRRLGQP